MSKKHLFLLVFLNLLIASSFFIKNIGVGYTQLSSDMQNIVPMCMKLDNNALYPNDLYLTDTDNFKFYTPFYIETLRFIASCNNSDYIKATNILLFLSSLLFGLAWFFLLFKILKKNFWIALLISVFMRGIVWLPMGEIWGISDLWTMMPRTLYIALMPIPFLLLFIKKPILFYLAALLIGLIFNFHPISGLGGILIFISLVFFLNYFKYKPITFWQIFKGMLLIGLGMLPFIVTYFGKTDAVVVYNINDFQAAFNAKISSQYQEIDVLIKSWLKLKFLFFVIPLVLFIFYSFKKLSKYRNHAIIIVSITILLILLPILSICLENGVNDALNTNLRMSFQLVRIQKLIILSGYLAIGFLMLLLTEKYNFINKYIPMLFGGYLLILIFSNNSIFNNVPFIGDDITRSTVPHFLDIIKPLNTRKTDEDLIAKFIEENTPVTAVFYNSYYLRSAAKRSVKFDVKGANLLVEGNPKKLIEWHKARMYLKNKPIAEKLNYLKENGVTYILSEIEEYPLPLVKQIGNQKLYYLE